MRRNTPLASSANPTAGAMQYLECLELQRVQLYAVCVQRSLHVLLALKDSWQAPAYHFLPPTHCCLP